MTDQNIIGAPNDTTIEVLTDRLKHAVEYARTFRADDEPQMVEACERSIRYANMLSQAILALTPHA